MARLLRPVTRMISSRPEATASSTTYWMVGLSTRGSISFGWALVAGRKRVPSPAAGKTALRTFASIRIQCPSVRRRCATKKRFGNVYYISMSNARFEMARDLFENAYQLQMQGDFELAAQFY